MVSGYTLTIFPNAIHAATTTTKSNSQQTTISQVYIQQGIGTAHKLSLQVQTRKIRK